MGITTLEELQTFIVSCPEPVKYTLGFHNGCFIATFSIEDGRVGWGAGGNTVEEATGIAARMAIDYFNRGTKP